MKILITLIVLCVVNFEQAFGSLSEEDIREIADLDDQYHYKESLQNILIPRVVGTKQWKSVQNYIVQQLKLMELNVELDSFEDNTPIFGRMKFVNIIGKLNPSADHFLVLSAHYDSKYFPEGEFLGATDSAVPCAIMLNIVKTTLPYIKQLLEGKNLGLMLIFFDGEEAFLEWTDRDSLYGSRHLAQKWELTPYKNGTEIDRINVLVLLDLIGSNNARFVCTFRNTCNLNTRLNEIEKVLKSTSSLKRIPNGPASIFLKSYRQTGVADDHIPFLVRKVPILHLIPQSFPVVWHTKYDDAQRLNQQAILNFNKIFRVFVVEYLSDCAANPVSRKCRFK
ncbi:CLUMA_CG009093, isoform A [Clunio marinus]|uniref:Glutaminyl-peptide cyclotransferase n=1 Tax=Clunio marinus TaxID=568069 RepID=A0A1J1I619_9DIPT|nr:CLUMA_CG009093, isoform A [Clunio marinus]